MNSMRLFTLSTLVLAISACTSLPHAPSKVLAEPNLPLAQSYELAQHDTATVSTADYPSLAGTRWQDFYSDDKLKALIELGLNNNKSLEQAVLAVQKSRAQYRITRASSYPTVGGSGGYTRGGGSNGDQNPSDAYSVGLAMSSYELDLWGKVAAQKEQALQSYLATSAAKDAAQISLISSIAQGYVNISYAEAQLILAQSTVKSRERSLFINQKRFGAGIDSKSPSLQADSSLESAKLAVLTAQTSLLQAKNALQLLIGSPIPDELMPEPAVTSVINPSLFNTGLPSELLYYRPDVAQSEYNLKAAGANINVARANFFPSISLSSSVGLRSSDLGDLFKAGTGSWSFGPSISVPIFNAGSLRANYEVAQIEQQQTLAAYEYAIQTAFKEVNDVLATRATLDEQIAAQYKLQKNYQQIYDIAFATFRSGLSNYLDVLDAERSLFGVQQSILELEQRKIVSQIELYQVLGGGATLNADQISSDQQAAMVSARLATDDEVATLSKDAVENNAVENTVPTTSDGVQNAVENTTQAVETTTTP